MEDLANYRIGRVKFYDPNKDFGFIEELTDPKQEDIYFNRNAIELTLPVDGEIVLFQPEESEGETGSRSTDNAFLISEAPFRDKELRDLASTIPDEGMRQAVNDAIIVGPSVIGTSLIDWVWMIGQVKFFDSEKGFGFIRPLRKQDVGSEDVYVNSSNVLSRTLNDGDQVAFRPIRSQSKSGSVEAVHVHPVTSFSGNPTTLRELLVEDFFSGSRSLRALHGGALQGLGPDGTEDYAKEVLEHLEGGRSENVAATLFKLKDRLESATSNDSTDDALLQIIRQKAGQLIEREEIALRKQVELFSEGLAPPPSPDVFDNVLSDESPRRQKSIAEKLSGSELEDYVSYVAESAESVTASGELLGQFRRLHRIIANADVDEAVRQRVEDQMQGALQDVIEDGRLDSSDVADLWKHGVLGSIPANVLAEAICEMESSEVVGSLRRLAPGKLLQVVKHRTVALFSEDAGSDRVESIADWLEALRDLSETNAGTEPVSESGEEAMGSKERALPLASSTIREACTADEHAHLYARGLLDDLPEEWVKEHVNVLRKDVLGQVLARERTTENLRKSVLGASISSLSEDLPLKEERAEADWIAGQVHSYFDGQSQIHLLETLVNAVRPETHLKLWEDEVVDIFPERGLNRHFEDPSLEGIRRAAQWCEEGLLSEREFSQRLDGYLRDFQDRVHPEVYPFIREAALQLESLVDLTDGWLREYEAGVQKMVAVALWRNSGADFPDLETVQTVFVALPPEEQIRTLRRLFYLHTTSELSLDIEDIERLSELDVESLQESKFRSGQVPAALTSEIVIKTLQKVHQEGELLLEGELLKIALQAARIRDEKNDLKTLFDQCTRRTEIGFGKASQTHYDNYGRRKSASPRSKGSSDGPDQKKVVEKKENGKRYFEIKFRYNEQLVEAVKKLPNRTYHPETKTWTVPGSKEGERAVKRFAKENTFFLELSENNGNHYANNPHLHELEDTYRPRNCHFCEGRHVGQHRKWGRDFWWCRSDGCFDANRSTRSPDSWEKYTLRDFISLLGIGGEQINDEDYGRYMGVLNRFKQLLSRLECRECGHYMHPIKDSAFAHYRVTHFQCVNEECCQCGEKVYLHHCLNSACSSVIDSRETEQCPNGWWICTSESCGACCSTETMKKRRDRLKRAQQQIPEQLQRFISKKKGHIERAEHFCHSCGDRMVWLDGDDDRPLFRCEKCEIEYDTSKAGFSYRNSEERPKDDPDRLKEARTQHEAAFL
jgi:cold shock CspA family protein